jgi:hypothetical protein
VPVLFYAVPDDRPFAPPTWFKPVWHEANDGWVRLPDEVGAGTPDIGIPKRTNAREWQVAPGAYLTPGLDAIEGTADQWARGTLHSEFLLGRYGPMRDCVASSVELILSDLDGASVVGGKGMGGDVLLSDLDGVPVGFDAPASGAAVLSDDDAVVVYSQPGATEPVALGDGDGLAAALETGGGPGWALSDLDALVVLPATGGEPGEELSDLDGLSITGEVSEPSGPGATCETAGDAPLGAASEATVTPGEFQWWRFPVTSGTTYRARYVVLSGDISNSAALLRGTCSGLTEVGQLNPAGCQSFTAAYTGYAYVRVVGSLMGSTTYRLTPDAGSCP